MSTEDKFAQFIKEHPNDSELIKRPLPFNFGGTLNTINDGLEYAHGILKSEIPTSDKEAFEKLKIISNSLIQNKTKLETLKTEYEIIDQIENSTLKTGDINTKKEYINTEKKALAQEIQTLLNNVKEMNEKLEKK